ncbi:MAG: MATE family efflux transporter [Lachnospiraceae bacterium]
MQETEHNKNDFSQGSIVRNILRLSVPMTMAQLINVLYNIVDRIYIGRIPEHATLSLTGLGLCLPIISIVMAFANLFGMGGAPLCSIERGRGETEEAERIMANSFCLMLLSGVLLTVAGLLLKRPMLYLFGASDQTFPFADQYISIYLFGTIFVMTGLGMNSFINCQGFGKTGMMTVLLGAIANIILDPLFIFVFGMGVQGAALATVISQALSMIWIVCFLMGKRTILRLRLSYMKLQMKRVGKIVALGLSGFTMSITNSLVQIMCNATLQQYGGDLFVGVMTIINSIREVVSMPVRGITSSAQPVMGYNYGAGEYKRVKQAIAFTSVITIIYTTVIWVLVSAFPEFFIRVFNQDADIMAATIPAMQLYYFGFCFMSLQFSGQAVFVALGKAKQAVFFSIFRKVVIVIPLTLLLPRLWGMGTDGVFLAEPVSNLIGGLACFLTMLIILLPELNRSGGSKTAG